MKKYFAIPIDVIAIPKNNITYEKILYSFAFSSLIFTHTFK